LAYYYDPYLKYALEIGICQIKFRLPFYLKPVHNGLIEEWKMKKILIAAALLPLSLHAQELHAQELKIGLSGSQSSADPHFHNLTPNNQLQRHIFEGLTDQDENQKAIPRLASSFKAINDTTWEFKLRAGVKFSDGTPFTANDIIYSYCRIPKVENSPSSFIPSIRAVKTMTASGDTLTITTENPHPLLPIELSAVGIIKSDTPNLTYNPKGCEGIASYPKTEDFNNLKLAIGTGPFLLKEFIKGEKTTLARNDAYWGEKPQWATVTMRPITQNAARVAALLAGDVDFIENPPVQDIPRIKANADYAISEGLSSRVIYLHFNYIDDKHPGLTDVGDKNPLRDKRVREALSKSIDRDAISARIMGGYGKPAAEMLPDVLQGTNKGIQHAKVDVEGAKKLLAEAGYPNGFGITLGAPNDRYVNDAVIAPAIAQMFTRIGVKTTVDAMTATTFFQKRTKRDFAVWLAGWSADTGEMSNPLRALTATPNKDKGFGSTNPGGYSNPEMDKLLDIALMTIDTDARNKLLAESSLIVMKDYALIPLHFEITTWAMKKGISYTPRVDQYTLASKIVRK
jgi:peptide/nickel transport system substrate-binding protein